MNEARPPLAGRWLLAVGALAMVVSWVRMEPGSLEFRAPGPSSRPLTSLAAPQLQATGWLPLAEGWATAEPVATARLPLDRWSQAPSLGVMIDCTEPAGLSVELLLVSGDRRVRLAAGTQRRRLLPIPRALRGQADALVFEARRSPDHSGRPDAVLRQLDLVAEVPALPAAPRLLLAPLLATLLACLVGARWGGGLAALLGLSGGLALAEIAALGRWRAPELTPALAGGLGLLALIRLPCPRRAHLAALGAVAFVGLWLRWQWLATTAGMPGERDIVEFCQLAWGLESPYATGPREPLLVWWIWLTRGWLGGGPLACRLLSVVAGAGLILATYALGARIFDRRTGLIAALLLATAAWPSRQAARGYRFELYLLLLIGCGWQLLRAVGWQRSLTLGVVGALAVLTRMSALPLLVLAVAADAGARWRSGAGVVPGLAMALLPGLLLVTPHLLHNQQRFGDPLHSVNLHARYYRNYEFAGAPGHMPRDQVEADPYREPPITVSRYLLGMHTCRQLISYYAHGMRELLTGRMARLQYFGSGAPGQDALVPSLGLRHTLALLGLVLWLGDPRGRRLLLTMLLLWGPVPFVLHATVKLDPRLIYQPAPLLELAAAFALLQIARAARDPSASRSVD